MKLLSFLLSKKSEKKEPEQFLALQIGTHHSKAAIWTNKGKELEIETVVNGLTPEEVIRKATEKFPVSQVLFGLSEDYIAEYKIKDERLPQLKRIADTFSLTPIGFVVISEAIAHLLESEQGAPQTAIFVTISQGKLSFSLFRVGKLTKTVSIVRTGDLIKDFETGLAQFTTEEVLPSKIIIDCEDTSLKNITEELLNYAWQENDKFLHVPKIELLPLEYSIQAIVQAGVSEMNDASAVTASVEMPEEHPAEVLSEEPDPLPGVVTKTSAHALGFSSQTETSEDDEPVTAVNHEVVTVKASPQPVEQPSAEIRKPRLPKFSMPQMPSLPQVHGLLPAAIAAVVLLAGLGITVYAYPKTTITLLAQPDIVEDEVTIKLNTNASDIDIAKGEIPGKVHSVTVSSEKTGKATGTKTIGEKATGKIALYNKSASERTFPKGTVLGITDMSFTLDEDVKIASASDTGESLDYGKASAKATASKIGPKGNIESNVELEVKDVSKNTALAKSEEKFSGGTEREINVVAEKDQDTLLADATEELKKQAREQLSAQIGSDEKFLDESLAENIVEKSFSGDVGEETDTLSLDLVLEISQTSYNVDSINRFLEGYMKEQIKEGYSLDAQKSFFRVIETEQDEDGNVKFTANYHAFLIPDVSLDGFKDKLAGAGTGKLESLVGELTDQNIVGYEVKQTRSLPFLGSRLPFLKNNIEVKVEVYE